MYDWNRYELNNHFVLHGRHRDWSNQTFMLKSVAWGIIVVLLVFELTTIRLAVGCLSTRPQCVLIVMAAFSIFVEPTSQVL